MAKKTFSFRIDDETVSWLEETAPKLSATKSGLLEDALRLATHTNNAAAENFGSMFRELAERYGEDAEIVTWVDEVDGKAVARVHINGEVPDDVRGHVTVDPDRGLAHVFLEVDGWMIVKYGSSYIGPRMVATLPIMSVVAFPWPPDPVQRTAAVAKIGDVIHGGAQAQAPELAAL